MHRRPRAMAGDIQQKQREMPLVQHLVAERVAADPGHGLIEPVGPHRPAIDRLRQDRGDVFAGLPQLLLHRVRVGRLILGAAVVAQTIRADTDRGAVLQRHGLGQAVAVDKVPLVDARSLRRNCAVTQFQPAVAARHGGAFQHEVGGRIASDRPRAGNATECAWAGRCHPTATEDAPDHRGQFPVSRPRVEGTTEFAPRACRRRVASVPPRQRILANDRVRARRAARIIRATHLPV